MTASSTYAESAIASDVAHMAWTAGMAPACGDDSSVSPTRVSSGWSASRARAANQEVIAFPISQLTSRNPQLVPLLPAAGAGDGLGLAAGEGGEDGCAASRTGVAERGQGRGRPGRRACRGGGQGERGAGGQQAGGEGPGHDPAAQPRSRAGGAGHPPTRDFRTVTMTGARIASP